MRVAVAWRGLAVVALAAACVTEATSAPALDGVAAETTAPPPATAPAPAPVDDLGLVIAAEHPHGYDWVRFEHWIDADYDGCSTRCEVLLAERRTDLPGVGTGWFSVYDWISTPNVADLDVDHLVPLAEAWRSGAHAWDDARRRAFANDLDEPDALVAVTATSNRQKGDKDPAGWLPPRREQWCWYASAWIRVKAKWDLTADPAEAAALRQVLASC